MQPTKDIYDQLDKAYRYFNKSLFDNRLPPCVLVLHRKRKSYGYFWGGTWSDREGKTVTDEIALNPDMFELRSMEDILSILVHEMCHLQQHHFGEPSRSGYHNREWADMMEMTGLIPTDTGLFGGKKTGQKVGHIVEPGGRFERACVKLLESGFTMPWQVVIDEGQATEKKATDKTKYSCASCGVNAWAKLDIKLICGHCMEQMLPQEAQAEKVE